MALTEVPVDSSGFRMALLMDAEPALVYDQENGGFTDQQQIDEDGRPLYTVSVAVQFEGAWGPKNEVMQVICTTKDGKDPKAVLFGQPVAFENLKARVSLNRRTNVATLRFSADFVVAKNAPRQQQ